ncbi:MAG: response regulator transcription factor [Eubacteriales bacterium]
MRVLVCEDQVDLNRLICKKLKSEGYGVDGCFDGEEGLFYMESAAYDLIILDVMMPKKDGYAVVSEMRARNDFTPVLFLTAKDATEDLVKGLDFGGNDYMVKPFSFDELMARCRVLLRMKPQQNAQILTVCDLEMNTSSRKVTRNGVEIELSAREYAILEYMLYHVNIVLSREQIEEHIWSFDYEGGSNLVNVYIRYLRKKVDDPFERKLIHTVRGSGYVLREEG